MYRRLTTHYRGVCKNIETGQKKIIEPEKEKEPILEPIIDFDKNGAKNEIVQLNSDDEFRSRDNLQEIQKTELKNTDSQPDFFNYTVVQKFPLLITVDDFKKGLENKTEFFNHLDENPQKIQILIKIKKYVLHT